MRFSTMFSATILAGVTMAFPAPILSSTRDGKERQLIARGNTKLVKDMKTAAASMGIMLSDAQSAQTAFKNLAATYKTLTPAQSLMTTGIDAAYATLITSVTSMETGMNEMISDTTCDAACLIAKEVVIHQVTVIANTLMTTIVDDYSAFSKSVKGSSSAETESTDVAGAAAGESSYEELQRELNKETQVVVRDVYRVDQDFGPELA